MTLDELSELTGLSRYQIFRLIKAERIRRGDVIITEKRLRVLVKQGLTVRQIADAYLCSVGCVGRRIKEFGINMGPPGNPNWAVKKCEHNEKSRG